MRCKLKVTDRKRWCFLTEIAYCYVCLSQSELHTLSSKSAWCHLSRCAGISIRRLLPDYSMNATNRGINELSGWYTVKQISFSKWKQMKRKTETETETESWNGKTESWNGKAENRKWSSDSPRQYLAHAQMIICRLALSPQSTHS